MDSLADDLERLRASAPRTGPKHARRRRGQAAWVLAVAAVLTVAFAAGDLLKELDGVTGRRRVARQVADDAAQAGARLLDPRLGLGLEAPCQAAWSAVVDRLGDDGAQPVDCAALAGPCRPDQARRATGRTGGATVVFSHPVAAGPASGRCRRFGVRVARDNPSGVAATLGLIPRRTAVESVAAVTAGGDEFAPLVVLDPSGCGALAASGGAGLQVWSSGDEGGLIVVESDGTAPGVGDAGCGAVDRWVIDVGDDAFVRALPAPATPARVVSHALARSAERAYQRPDARAGAACGAEAEPPCRRLQPRPVPLVTRRGREPVDRRYGDDVGRLAAVLGPTESAPPGFLVFPRPGTPDRCDLPPATPALTLTGNWYVRCPGTGAGQGFRVGSSVAFTGGAVVFEGQVTVGSGGVLSVNQGGSGDVVVAVRAGGLATSGSGALSLTRAFVHLAPGATLALQGTGPLTWTAPRQGPFADLAVWGDGGAVAALTANPGAVLEGLVFLPDAALRLEVTGGTDVVLRSQLVASRVHVQGAGVVSLAPEASRTVRYPVAEARLVG